MTKNPARIIWQEMENKVTNRTYLPHRVAVVLLLVFALILSVTPAEARKPPKRTGPLNLENRQCARETFRTRVNGRLEVVAKTETCLLDYEYDPLAEDDEERDYGIAWVQARIEPRGAWCATRVWSDLGVSRDTRLHKRTPMKNFSLKKSRRVEVKLASTANGFGDKAASLRERTWFRPRQLRHTRSTVGDSRIFTQRWTGQRGGVINLTSGAEISWAENDAPDALASGLRYDFERRGRC